jgi:hypothetical protein
MTRKRDTKNEPAVGSKPARAGKRPHDAPQGPPTAEDAAETERETQARESESAFDRALERFPPG